MTPQAIRRSVSVALVLLLAAPAAAVAQQKLLTLDDIYGQNRINFTGRVASGFQWIDASHYASPRVAAQGVDWLRVEAVSGRSEPLFDADKLETALAKLPGVSAEEARRASHSRALEFNSTFTAVLLT